ncbi:hypothetical protein [Aeromonas veronii]|uniref:hypothetical protein n=1 Tax=Aeromonas veronii TaxID=654 RepID=UPI0011177964|nr:hypothetical protein [Aeromonas veronii]
MKTAALSCGFYFYSPNTFALNFSPLAQLSLSAEKAVNMHAKATGGHGIGSPANRRVEFNGSGAPSGMMAQPQSA